MGILHRAYIKDVEVRRNLSVIINSNRYRSKAADAFIREILPQFCTEDNKEGLNKLFQAQKVFLETNSNLEIAEN
jgi:hypothetical protein